MGSDSLIAEQTSSNFAAAKVLSIILVVTGHFFDGSLLWIPVTVGLFVFAYSSAYFTTKKYGDSFQARSFWSNKIGRLAIPFWVSQGFLLLLFLITNREGIWTWQTLVHWLGQSGWLNWFAINNASPFGSGLWFFTLLLIFYLLFPFLAKWNQVPFRAHFSLPVFLVIALWLDREVKVGHALWLTAFAFWFGAYAARYPIRGSALFWFVIGAGSVVAMLAANLLGLKALNIYLLIAISVAAVQWLERAPIQKEYCEWALWLGPCILEIYLIHTFLFIKGDLSTLIRYVVSMVLIIAVAMLLSWFSGLIAKRTFATAK